MIHLKRLWISIVEIHSFFHAGDLGDIEWNKDTDARMVDFVYYEWYNKFYKDTT